MQLLNVQINGHYLDVGCGSGNYTGALSAKGLNIEGIDISKEMLTKARQKHPTIQFLEADARQLPYKNDSFDGATCILATHHIQDNQKLFQECFRVLKNGNLVIFTATPEQMKHYWLHYYFPEMMQDAMNKMASESEINLLLQQSGFKVLQSQQFFITKNMQDLFLHAGKYRPSLYLDQKVRDGISSFHLSTNPTELNHGLKKLATDIDSGRINTIIEDYESDLGEYLFIIGQKER